MIRKTVLVSALVLLTVSVWAQMGGAPGAEVKKMDYFVGSWTAEGTIAEGPWGAGGKFSSDGHDGVDAGQFLHRAAFRIQDAA